MSETQGLPSVEEVARVCHAQMDADPRDKAAWVEANTNAREILALFAAAVPRIKAEALREAAAPGVSEWARKMVEDELIELRDARISLIDRGNGLVVREADRTDSSIIRLGFEMAWATCLKAHADRIEAGQ